MQVTVMIRTKTGQFVGGTVAGDWRIELALSSDPLTIIDSYEGPSPSHNFELVDGTAYNARGYRIDGTGAVLGPIASGQFTAGDDVVELEVADTISAATVLAPPARAATKAK